MRDAWSDSEAAGFTPGTNEYKADVEQRLVAREVLEGWSTADEVIEVYAETGRPITKRTIKRWVAAEARR
jgi:hypothetical protein